MRNTKRFIRFAKAELARYNDGGLLTRRDVDDIIDIRQRLIRYEDEAIFGGMRLIRMRLRRLYRGYTRMMRRKEREF